MSLPEMVTLLADHECASFAAQQIRVRKPDASEVVSMLVELVESKFCTTSEVVQLLEEFGGDLSYRVSNWIVQLSSDDDSTYRRAVYALGTLVPQVGVDSPPRPKSA
ncbi:MAG: hypothetical protein KDB01_01340 [Planctomycetaceae bacterium]|nr:hypothetical protein [Planctomycetaceae bacterium]